MGAYISSNHYDWKPELPDFRDRYFKYNQKISNLPEKIDLSHRFKEFTQDFGCSTTTCVSAVLDFYKLNYTCNFDSQNFSIRNSIKSFTIFDNANDHTISRKLKYDKICPYKNQIKQSLIEGIPIIFGFTIYESFKNISNENNILKIPNTSEKILGGLCGIIVGYNNENRTWKIKLPFNSFNLKYIEMPYELLFNDNNLGTDFWRIHKN